MSNQLDAVKKIYNAFNTGDTSVLDAIIAPNARDHEAPDLQPGPEGVKQAVAMFRGGFPDVNMTVEDAIEQDDKVVVRFRFKGTHQGEFMGIAATGRPVDIQGVDIVRFESGKAVEHWGFTDQMTMMQQMGAMPAQ